MLHTVIKYSFWGSHNHRLFFSYVNFMKNTLVATPATAKRPSRDLVDSPNTGMRDLILTLTEVSLVKTVVII